jgi:hypothetical protein
MSLLRSLRRQKSVRAAGIAYRLHCLRFMEVLEKVCRLADLHADGTEKAQGDYILDRHYAEALVDEALEMAGSILFDACVLVPDGGGHLLERLDDHVERARGILREFEQGSRTDGPPGKDDEEDLDPEYLLLCRVLEWIGGPGSESEGTLRDLVREAVRHGIVGSRDRMPDVPRAPVLRCQTPVATNEIRWVDTGMEGRDPTVREEELPKGGGRLLRMMVKEASREGKEGGEAGRRRKSEWVAAERDGRLSLWRAGGSSHVRLEASLGGTPGSDLLFLYASGDADLEQAMGEGFLVERTGPGFLAWYREPGVESIEASLLNLGCLLFGTSGESRPRPS